MSFRDNIHGCSPLEEQPSHPLAPVIALRSRDIPPQQMTDFIDKILFS